MASSRSRAADVQFALQRARKKICELQMQLNEKPSEETSWSIPSKELRDSLVDMYKDNPGVNQELRQRLPQPARQQQQQQQQHGGSAELLGGSERSDLGDALRVPHHLPQLPASCSASAVSPVPPVSHRRVVSPEGGAASSPTPRGHLAVMDSWSSAGRLSEDQNVSFLLKELDNLRLTNNTLQEQLVQKEKLLQSKEVQEELREAQEEAELWKRPTALLEEVLAAQKDREQALMSRLLLANEERDEALLRVRRLQHAAQSDSGRPDDCEQDVDQLLHRICGADSAHEICILGSSLVQQLRLARQRRDDITAEEMKAVMEQRDTTVAKLKHPGDFLQDGERQTSQAELLSLQRERDRALEERRRLEAELQALRSNQSLRDLAPPSLPDDSVSVAPPLLVQLQQMSLEKDSMEAELHRSHEAELEAGERVRRLERLVEVLRKKVGSGRPRAVV